MHGTPWKAEITINEGWKPSGASGTCRAYCSSRRRCDRRRLRPVKRSWIRPLPLVPGTFFRVFPQKQICAFQGDFSYCQCSQPCRDDIWENREIVKELTGYLVGVRLPEEAVPRCPDCGRMLVPWVRDDTFLEGTFWQDSLHRYHRFLRRWIMDQSDKKVLLLELGVGEMTPSIIKLPFWELTAKNENVFYACLNREVSHRPEHLRGRSLYLQGDLAETLAALRQIHRSNHKIERGERI